MDYNSNGVVSSWEATAKYRPLEAGAPKPFCINKTTVNAVKLTGIFMLIACLQVSARTNAQRVSISLKNSPLEKLFTMIEKKTSYVFFYDVAIIKNTKPVTIEVKNASVEDVLQTALKGQELEYAVSNLTIFIKKTKKIVVEQNNGGGPGAATKASGVVLNETGLPLSGASVTALITGKSTITNARGEFELTNVPIYSAIQISFIGYTSKKVEVKVGEPIQVQLAVAANQLDESVVQAYGNTTQRLNTGNITKVSSKEIEEQPVSNPLAALEGRVPGLIINQTTGVPGGGFTVQLRGVNSIGNGVDPYYVIDGVPYPSQTLGSINGSLNGGNPLNFINPSDIESIEVLKDADATAIYGSRAANGAILITTKKGRAGTMQLNLNAYTGFGKMAREEHLLNTQQYLQMRHEAFANDNKIPAARDYDINGTWDTTRYTDWQKVFLNNPARYDDAQFSVSGGNTNTQYLIGGGYHRETTVFPKLLSGDGEDHKASVHFNINSVSPDKKFKISLTGSYVSDKNTVQSEDFYQDALITPPDAPALYNSDGSLNWMPLTPGQAGTWRNPFSRLYQTFKGTTSNLVGNTIISYNLFPGLELKTSLGYTNTQTDEVQAIPTTSYDPGSNITSGSSTFSAINTHSWIIEPQVNYKLNLGKGILTALVGGTFQENINSSKVFYASGFSSDALLEDVQAAPSIIPKSTDAQYKYTAAFGRVNYNWEDKYLLNITARRDGSSRFGPGRQFANFGAIGAGWIFSREKIFQQRMAFLSFGKIRGSYGSSGNDQIGDYQFLDLYTLSQLPYQSIQPLQPASLFNPDLAWELNKKLEVALELGFLKDRIIIQASFYQNRCGNQLLNTPVSGVTGFGSIPSNLPAVVQNTGEEFVLNTINVKSKNFTWSSSFNISFPHNKLLAFPSLASSSYQNTYQIGKSIQAFKVYHLIGINDTTGLYQFSGEKGPTSSPNSLTDRATWVNKTPQYFGGFRNAFQYKGFSLDIFLQFVKQIGSNIWASYGNMPGLHFNEPMEVLDRWQKPGDRKLLQRFSQNYSSAAYKALNYAKSSDFVYSDASFIRLKNLAFSYSLPERWKHRLHLQNLRIYIQGQNLITITKYRGIDPESQSISLPPLRVYTAGFQVTL